MTWALPSRADPSVRCRGSWWCRLGGRPEVKASAKGNQTCKSKHGCKATLIAFGINVPNGESKRSNYLAAHQPLAAGFSTNRVDPVGIDPQPEPHRGVCKPIGVSKIADRDQV
jgi:hypothetical protein